MNLSFDPSSTTSAIEPKGIYLDWCIRMLDIHYQARQGYEAFIETHALHHFDNPRYREKAWIPYAEVKTLAEQKAISLHKALKLRNEFHNWIEAIRWSDPDKTTAQLANLAKNQVNN